MTDTKRVEFEAWAFVYRNALDLNVSGKSRYDIFTSRLAVGEGSDLGEAAVRVRVTVETIE